MKQQPPRLHKFLSPANCVDNNIRKLAIPCGTNADKDELERNRVNQSMVIA